MNDDDTDPDDDEPKIRVVDQEDPIDKHGPCAFSATDEGDLTVWFFIGPPVSLMGAEVIVTRARLIIEADDFDDLIDAINDARKMRE